MTTCKWRGGGLEGSVAAAVFALAALLLSECRPRSSQIRSTKPYDANPTLSTGDYQTFVRATNDFGLNLFQRIAEADNNVFYSPSIVATMLGLVYVGARNGTAEQIAAALGPRLPESLFHVGTNRLELDFAARRIAPTQTADGEKSLELTFVRSVWAQEGYSFVPSYLDTLSTRYDTGVNVVDFRKSSAAAAEEINRWVATQTKGKIKTLLGDGTLSPATRLLLVGSVHFRGTWEESFDPNLTHPRTFRKLDGRAMDVPTMHAQRASRYSEGDGFQALELPYYRQRLSMVIVLPAEGRFPQVRAQATSAWLEALCAKLCVEQVMMGIPKFELSMDAQSLKEPLRAMGVHDAFGEGADFSGIESKRELVVADIVQQTYLGVSELGTEAAAAAGTQVAVSAADLPGSRIFEVDRPFLVFIRDSGNGFVLFEGQIMNPLSRNGRP